MNSLCLCGHPDCDHTDRMGRCHADDDQCGCLAYDPETYHTLDCGGTCDGCGYIAADGLWYPGPCPEGERGAQLERAGGA